MKYSEEDIQRVLAWINGDSDEDIETVGEFREKYGRPELPPEPSPGTVIIDNQGEAWQRSPRNFDSKRWFCALAGIDYSWEDLHDDDLGPFKVAVPLTDDERAYVARLVRKAGESRYNPATEISLADRIEGTQP